MKPTKKPIKRITLQHIHAHLVIMEEEFNKQLSQTFKKTTKIMATIAELNQKVDDLQVSVDAKQEQIAAAVAALQQTIADLQAIIDNAGDGGATPEELQGVLDKVEAAKTDLEATPV